MQRHHGTTRPIDVTPEEGGDYVDLELPDTIARQAQSLAGSEEPPRTLGEQSRLFAQTKAFQAEEGGDVEEMLVTDESRHAVHVGEDTINTYCFLDALGIALLQDGPVEVTTRPPGMDETIDLTVSREGISGSSPEMVVAYGFSTGLPTDVAELEELSPEETLAAMHEHGCPTQNLFPDQDAYQAWAREADAATMPMSLAQALAMVHDYVEDWTLEEEEPGHDVIDIRPADGESYAKRDLPDEITGTLRVLTGLTGVESAPETLGDFAELNSTAAAFSPENVGVEEMLMTQDSRHEVRWGNRDGHTNCILDALILAFLADGPVDIATCPPGSNDVIELTASELGIRGAREGMVVSFGFSTQLPSDPAAFEEMDEEEVLAVAHQHGCPKINLFEDEKAYEAWASQADAITMAMSLPQALTLARDTVRGWEEELPADAELQQSAGEILPELPEEITQMYENVSFEEFETEELLVDEDDTRHEVRWGDRTKNTYCVLDALILGVQEESPVEIATRPPGSADVIEFTISEHGMEGAPEQGVVSFGFSTELPHDAAELEDIPQEEMLEIVHEHGCPTINLFESQAAYDAWASQAEAESVSMSLEEALVLAREIVEMTEH